MSQVSNSLPPRRKGPWTAALLALLALAAPVSFAGDAVFDAAGASARRPTETQFPFEHVDPLTGNLLLTFTDLVLPGNGGLDLVIQRTYNSKAVYYDWEHNGNTLGEDTWAGVGWNLHMGRIRWVSGADIQGPMEMPDGSQHRFFHHIDGSGRQITRDFWVLDKSTTPPTVSLPNGLVYEFGGPIVFLPAGYGSDNSYLYVTKIRDAFGNSIEINYMTGAGQPRDGISSIVQNLGNSQTRTVTFTADATARKSLTAMTYGSRTWTYAQTAATLGATTRSVLTGVTPPVPPGWTFTYSTTSSSTSEKDEITGLTTPNGGTIAYTFSEKQFYLGSPAAIRSRALATRTTGGRDVTGGQWVYNFAYGATKNQTKITIPNACSPVSNGSIVYTFHGVGTFTSGTVPVWKIGLIEQKDTLSGTTVLESESYADSDGWQASAAISGDEEFIPNGYAHDIDIWVPLVNVRRVTRGSKTYVTDNNYHTTNLSDFGQPYQVVETGDTAGFSRTTTRTFDFAFTPYIRDRIAQEDVTVGGETFTSSFVYNHANGFKTSETTYGITRTFTPYLIGGQARGDVDKVTDAEGKWTSFTYSWGVLKDTVTPAYTITRTVNSDGTIANEYRGTTANQWSYTYDSLMRPLTRDPAAGNTFTTTYDNTAGTWIRTTRGSSWTQTNLDGFGRPSSTQTAGAVKSDTSYDACGRETYVSYPYTGSANIGATFEFDELGRIKKKTNPDSTWVGYTYSNGIDVDVRNERNLTTKLDFAAFGNPDEQRLVKVTDANNAAWDYAYNALGSLTSMTPPVGTARTWEYYPTNLLKKESHPELGTLSESTDAISYTYYLNGMLKTRQDPQFNTPSALTSFTYDLNNRLTGIDYPTAYNAFDTTIGYDNFDHRTSVVDSYVSTGFTYDNGQRLTSRTDTVDLDGPGGVAAKTISATFVPDGNDNVAEIDYPSGEKVSYNFDLDNRVSKAFDTAATTTVYANTVTYHASGGITSYLAGNGLTHTTTYDPNTYRVDTINAGGKLQLDYALYDAVGNLKTLNDLGRSGMNQTFDYDSLDRMTTASGPWGSGSFTYHARGDRNTKTVAGSTTTYGYHSTKTTQLTSTSSTSGGDVDSFAYDQNGNLTSGFGSTFTYTPANTVATSTPTGGATTTYRYDQESLRKVKATGSDVRYYAHGPGGTLLSEMCAVGGTGGLRGVRDYVYVGQRLVAELETDAAYTVELVSATASPGEGVGTHTPQVRLLTASATTGPVTVRYGTANGTATAGTDYTAVVNGVVTFPTGSTNGATQPAPVTILNDQVVEANEDFTIQLSEPSCGAKLGATTIQTVTILDDEPTVTVTIANSTVAEGAGSAPVTVQVVPANGQPLSNTVTVQYATANGTAVAGSDYTAQSGTLQFTPALPGPQTVNVPILDDTVDEPDQTFTLGLSNVTGGTLGSPSVQTVTIQDNDPTAVVTLDNPTVTEGNSGTTNLVFAATLDRQSEWNPSVSFATADGTALSGSDYYGTNGPRTFVAGATSFPGWVNVGVMTDRVSEGTETFSLVLSNPVNLVIGMGGTGTITDDDGAGLAVEDGSSREGLAAQVKIRLSPAATSAVDVDWATVSGTATGGVDYTTASGTAHFGVGDSQVTVPVPTTLDGAVEGVETFTVQLSNAVGAPIATAVGTVKIVDGELGTDFDGDAKTDLVWREPSTASFQVWFMNGATQIGTAVTNPPSAPAFRLAGTGSFQPGGRNDMLLQNESSTQIYVWLMSGLTALGANPTPNFQPDAAYTVAGTGDFNQDGKTDILWWHQVNGTLQVWLMNGVVQTSSSPTTPAGVVDLNWQVAGTGDFNQDGKPDILWRNATSGRFVAWLMDGLTRTSGTFLVPEMLTDLNWRVMSSRDMDGDGKTDLVWQHQVSHRVVIWFMDGIYRRSGTFTSPDGGAMTTWVVAGPR